MGVFMRNILMESLLLFHSWAKVCLPPQFSVDNIRDTNGKGKHGMLNILRLTNTGRDWYMVRHYNVSPLIPNQYHDMCNRTCFDRNVLLIKCDAVSAQIAVVLCSQQLYLASENIDILSTYTISHYTGHLCSLWLSPVLLTRINGFRVSVYLPSLLYLYIR